MLVIVNERDVVVVDGGGIPRSAANAVALIKKVPVSVLVDTHRHGDHTLGKEVYRESWPDARILRRLFDAWWKQPIVRSAWLEAKGLPSVQGASDETG